jgi:hypothetical protein
MRPTWFVYTILSQLMGFCQGPAPELLRNPSQTPICDKGPGMGVEPITALHCLHARRLYGTIVPQNGEWLPPLRNTRTLEPNAPPVYSIISHSMHACQPLLPKGYRKQYPNGCYIVIHRYCEEFLEWVYILREEKTQISAKRAQ